MADDDHNNAALSSVSAGVTGVMTRSFSIRKKKDSTHLAESTEPAEAAQGTMLHASTSGPGSPKACKSALANSIISNDSEVNYADGVMEAVMERRHKFGEIGIIPKVWEGDSMLEDYCVFAGEINIVWQS